MPIVILALGSRGDVQPLVALGVGLRSAGYNVVVASHENFRRLITDHGLGFRLVGGNPQELILSEKGKAWMRAGSRPVFGLLRFIHLLEETVGEMLDDSLRACCDADAVLGSPIGVTGYQIARKLGVPFFGVAMQPQHGTGEFPSVVSPPRMRLGPFGNRFTHFAFQQTLWQLFRVRLNRWLRRALDLPSESFWGSFRSLRREVPVLYGFSPSVVAKPRDWGPNLHVTGYWFLDRSPDWRPPADLVDFLRAGPPPVYVGIGSMVSHDPAALTRRVLEALDLSGSRAVLLTGWGGIEDGPVSDHIYRVRSIPHDWLFPRMAAIIHHGGAGTTGAALRSGVPAVITPMIMDQPFWAHRVWKLGAGTQPIPFKKLTAQRLAGAIRQAVSDREMRDRAAALGRRIRAERGVARAAEILTAEIAENNGLC